MTGWAVSLECAVVGGGVVSVGNGDTFVVPGGVGAVAAGEPAPTSGRESKNVPVGCAVVLLGRESTGGVRSAAGEASGTVSGRYAAGNGARSPSGKMTRAVICS